MKLDATDREVIDRMTSLLRDEADRLPAGNLAEYWQAVADIIEGLGSEVEDEAAAADGNADEWDREPRRRWTVSRPIEIESIERLVAALKEASRADTRTPLGLVWSRLASKFPDLLPEIEADWHDLQWSDPITVGASYQPFLLSLARSAANSWHSREVEENDGSLEQRKSARRRSTWDYLADALDEAPDGDVEVRLPIGADGLDLVLFAMKEVEEAPNAWITPSWELASDRALRHESLAACEAFVALLDQLEDLQAAAPAVA